MTAREVKVRAESKCASADYFKKATGWGYIKVVMKFISERLMVKYIAIVLVLYMALPHSSSAEEILGYDISVLVQQQHPFLIDHDRKLFIRKNEKTIVEIFLYPDPGWRVPLSIFGNKDRLIFIDCNGSHYELSLSDAKFNELGWFWEKELPSDYIGTFRLRENDKNENSFKKEETVELKNVYLFKDMPIKMKSDLR